MITKLVTVVIPIYNCNLKDYELKSFEQCLTVLRDYPITIIKPKSLDVTSLLLDAEPIDVISFPDSCFENVLAYNELMLSDYFYKEFLDCEFMLIHQLDAYVFKDELEYWCNKKYDYIGAPWLESESKNIIIYGFKLFFRLFHSKIKKERRKIFFKVGNGGFSLRKTKKHFEITTNYKIYIKTLLKENRGQLDAIEDVFWSLKAKELDSEFNTPKYREALKFAFDRKPSFAFKLNNYKLPFGCHGFNKPKVANFWKPIIKY